MSRLIPGSKRLSSLILLAALLGLTRLPGAALAGEPPEWKYSPQLLRPFWQGDTVEGESVLFVKNSTTGQSRAALLFPVLKVLSIRNAAADVTYEEGRDYTWQADSREISLPAGSRIVTSTPQDLRRPAKSQKYQLTHRDGNGEILFGAGHEYHDLQTCITYTHAPNLWKTDVPKFSDELLPRTIGKLRGNRPLTIVLLGDSISTGCNASGWAETAPFQPAYQDLLKQHLEERCASQVTLKDLSVGGTDTAWGLTMIDKVVEARPDLVILAFGMNDSARRPAKEYQANTETMIGRVRESLPDCELILIASMLGNRDWVSLNHELFPQYRDALARLSGPGVALADMTSIWTGFLEVKRDWDLTGNGVNHPNDFGHRVYAQVLATLLVPPAAR